MTIANLIGQRFERLVVIRLLPERTKRGQARWFCKCDCGGTAFVETGHLRNGNSRSCGCLHKETFGNITRKHGMSKTKIYHVWGDMIRRCTDRNYREYHLYGGRGITVCDEWRKFENFYQDMGDIPKGMEIDRKDNNKGYSKENCRWVTALINSNNKRNNIILTVGGESHTLKEWSRITGINYGTLRSRYHENWSELSIFSKPRRINLYGSTNQS